jgi:ketopantoate reductase
VVSHRNWTPGQLTESSIVLRHVKDAGQKFDFVICTNKAVDQASTAADVAPAVGDDTSLVIIQNGVGNEDAFRERFPSTTIISCVVRLYTTPRVLLAS